MLRDFIEHWKDAAKKHDRESIDYLFVEPVFIKIPKTDLARSVVLCINNNQRDNFKFVNQNQEYFVFETAVKNNYAYEFNNLRNK